jgi:hypothetical protein
MVWTQRSYTEIKKINDVIWCPDLSIFCAVGQGYPTFNQDYAALTSTDGITWTGRQTPHNAFYPQWIKVCWASSLNLFVAASSNSRVQTYALMSSSDGSSWTNRDPGTDSQLTGLEWSPGLSTFCGIAGTTTITSTNGTSWSAHAAALPNIASYNIVWSPYLGVFCASSGLGVMTSTDGINWNETVNSDVADTVIAWSPTLNKFFANNNLSEKYYLSNDGITWTEKGSNPSGFKYPAFWSTYDQAFYMVCSPGTYRVRRSADGVTVLTDTGSNFAFDSFCIASSPTLKRIVALGLDTVAPNLNFIASAELSPFQPNNAVISPGMDY